MQAYVEEITMQLVPDDDPDLSWLKQPGATNEDHERIEEYGHTWHMVGVQAVAEIMIPHGDDVRITQTITSPGIWNVESDAGEHLEEIFEDEKAVLFDMLKTLNVAVLDETV